MTKPVSLPRWAYRFTQPARYKCIYGGRGSGKTWAVAHILVAQAAQRPDAGRLLPGVSDLDLRIGEARA